MTGGIVEEARERLVGVLTQAYLGAAGEGLLPMVEIPSFVVEVPREHEHGDFAANLALMLAGAVHKPPRVIAELLAARIRGTVADVEAVEVAGPGFINFRLRAGWVLAAVPLALELGSAYGKVDLGGGQKVQVEFVSANPTGLLHMGNARGAALGDALAALLAFADYTVEREFYINDTGHQIDNMALSLEARYLQELGRPAEVPEDGYFGTDLVETARRFVGLNGAKYLDGPESQRRQALVRFGLAEKLASIERTLGDFGVQYDRWFSESGLHDSGEVLRTIAALTEKGCTYEKDGALWFKAADLGKDEVLVRQNGVPTYFAADIAYHVNKLARGYTQVIDIWGADHHGHVARLHAALAALDLDDSALTVIIMQLVRLLADGEIVRMSKRTGKFVTLEELVEEVGKDAARYFFVLRSAESHLDFDLDLARQRTNDNPVYYIQYAHARICSIFRQWAAEGGMVPTFEECDLGILGEEAELALARQIAWFPEEIELAARSLAPHRLARYTHELAGLLHSFYNSHRVITEDIPLTSARLALVGATRVVLQNACRIIGISTPERM